MCCFAVAAVVVSVLGMHPDGKLSLFRASPQQRLGALLVSCMRTILKQYIDSRKMGSLLQDAKALEPHLEACCAGCWCVLSFFVRMLVASK